MKALVLTAPGELKLQEVPIEEPGDNEILIRVKACGVCGTDLHMYHGGEGAFKNSFPLIMGHEFAGEVVKCGKGATKYQSGDRVAVDPNVYCGQCDPCLRGDVHYCENMIGIGTTRNGGFAEYCTVPEKAAYLIPEELSFDSGAMMEPVSCCLHGIDRSEIHSGDTIAVIGFGAIGQIVFQLAKCAGASRIIVLEPDYEKRKKAEEMGAFLTIDSVGNDVNEALRQSGINRISSVIECVGRKETMEMAIEIASNRGTVMLFGLTPPRTKLEINAFEDIFQKELTITGSYINPLVAQRSIDLLNYGSVDMSLVITDRISLERGAEVFADDSYRSHGKIVIGDF